MQLKYYSQLDGLRAFAVIAVMIEHWIIFNNYIDLKLYYRNFEEYLFIINCFFLILRASENGFKFLGKRILENYLITFTGKISYGLYLYHTFAISIVWMYLSPVFGLQINSKYMAWGFYFAISLLLATASFYIIEKPFNNLKKHFKY